MTSQEKSMRFHQQYGRGPQAIQATLQTELAKSYAVKLTKVMSFVKSLSCVKDLMIIHDSIDIEFQSWAKDWEKDLVHSYVTRIMSS